MPRFFRMLLCSLPLLAWSQPSFCEPLKSVEYDGKTPAHLTDGDFDITIDSVKPPPSQDGSPDDAAPRATGTFRGKPAFVMTFDGAADPTAKVMIVKLAGDIPQVVFQHFSSGAHCCTETKIASTTNGETWKVIDGDSLDGDAGYTFKDVDGDGHDELISQDDGFLYAYASYAESIAPVKIQEFDGTKLIDVTADPKYRRMIQDDLDAMEKSAKEEPTIRHSNGFLAAWVADKIRLGDGPAAWSMMLKDYNRQPDMAPQVCAEPVPLAKCPDGKTKDASFPVALRADLLAGGYIKSADAYPIPPTDAVPPKNAEPAKP